ncbi:MAG: hypothetical protein V1866_02465 [archaeon]
MEGVLLAGFERSEKVDLSALYLPYRLIRKPSIDPSINVIIDIGINDVGSFHPMIIAAGSKTKKDIIIPFRKPLIFIFDVDIKNPDTIQRENADRLASQLNF